MAPPDPAEELQRLVLQALDFHPAVKTAGWEWEQARQTRRAADGFFDPRVTVSAGGHAAMRRVPGMSVTQGTPDRSAALQGVWEVPVRPGGYVSLGFSERYLFHPTPEHSGLFQTLVGAGVRIPLVRDRGFRNWDFERRAHEAVQAAAAAWWKAAAQEVRHQTTRFYLDLLAAAAELDIARKAEARFQALWQEANERVRLQELPAYQTEPLRLERELRGEEVLQARAALDSARERLIEFAGPQADPRPAGMDAILEWSLRSLPSEPSSPAPPLYHRGDMDYLAHLAEVADLRAQKAREEARTDLTLEAGLRWQAEERDHPLGTRTLLTEEPIGGEILLVWRRTLGRVAEKADGMAAEAEREAALERLRALEMRLLTDHRHTEIRLAAARERLDRIRTAIEAAEATLRAEEERFRLGDGRSRNVLDAQNDLIGVTRRQIRLSMEILHAASDYEYIHGYAGWPEAWPYGSERTPEKSHE